MRRYSQKQGLSTLSEINITPLLDLAFVLLIIFMITTPMLENSVDLVVPSSAVTDRPVDTQKVQTVSIDRNDVLKLNMGAVTASELENALSALRQKDPQVAVVVRAHRDLPLQKFISVMGVVQRTGITKVGVMTRPEED